MWRLLAACLTGAIALVIFGLVVSAITMVGPSEQLRADPVEIGGDTRALVLDEAIVPYGQTTATLRVDSDTPVFVGAANGVDTASYLEGVPQEQITGLTFEGPIEHRAIPGEANLPAPPEDIDWWASSETGENVTYTFDLDAEPQTIVVVPLEADGTLDISVAAELRASGVFGLSLAGAALGFLFLGLALYFGISWWQNRLRPRPKRRLSAEDEASWREGGRERREQIAAAEKARPSRRRRSRDDEVADSEDSTPAEEPTPRRRDRRRGSVSETEDARGPDPVPERPAAAPARPSDAPEKPSTPPSPAGSSEPTAPATQTLPARPEAEPFPTRRSRKNSHA